MESGQAAGFSIRELTESEIDLNLFSGFQRRQVVEKCWRKVGGEWVVRPIAFVEEWGDAEYRELVACLKNTVSTGGAAFGAFENGRLIGFCSVEGVLFGKAREYIDLSCIHVSEDRRGRGVGRRLFMRAVAFGKRQGAKKLYISAHSSMESQAFYRAMGCVEAAEYDAVHVEKEPCDCQLERVLE